MELSMLVLDGTKLGEGVSPAVKQTLDELYKIHEQIGHLPADARLAVLTVNVSRLRDANPEKPEEILTLAAYFIYITALISKA